MEIWAGIMSETKPTCSKVAIPSKACGSASSLSAWRTNKRPSPSQKSARSPWKTSLLSFASPALFSQETSISVTRRKRGPFWRDEFPRAFSRSGRSYKKINNVWKAGTLVDLTWWGKYVRLCDPTCCEISMVRIFFWTSTSSVWYTMQYLKHSTTEVTMTALSDGLVAARSLDRLRQKRTTI